MTQPATPQGLTAALPDSRPARRAILAALRGQASAEDLPRPDIAPFLAGPFGQGAGDAADVAALISAFETSARGWRTEVVHASPADWPQALRGALERHGCRRIAIGAASPLEPALTEVALQGLAVRRFDSALQGAWKGELFDAIDAGVTAVDAGIAHTGTLLLRPGPGEPRSLSLVPPVHVAVLRSRQLQPSLPAALRHLGLIAPGQPEAALQTLPTNLVLITGPSKTSDIQQTLAFGAHGPKVLVIVLVHDHDAA
ncbi:MAG: hypothetical protein RL722_983 [Pseudomonadota bacterium]|jgi:L-lactate dehydrogenase complex protein LldG